MGESELFTMTELAAEYGMSRKTAYKWLERYDAEEALGCAIVRVGPIKVRWRPLRSLVETLIADRHRRPHWDRRSCSPSPIGGPPRRLGRLRRPSQRCWLGATD
jgi:hypothetical protein